MAFPTLEVRPNEKNPKVLRLHEFLRQSNQLVERNMINLEGRKMLAKMLTKAVAEVKEIYTLDAKRAELAKSGKLFEQLKLATETSRSVMEERFVLADLARQVQEKKLDCQRNFYECDHLRQSIQSTNAEIRREREVNEKRLANTKKATGELMAKSFSILKLLENSTDVCKFRKIEEEKKNLVEEVNVLRDEKKTLSEDICSKKATLKAESKKPFQKTVIDCAKHYKLWQSLAPKLLKSKKNLEVLKDEEESRRVCGSLDETMQFDRSFVLAAMDKEKSPEKTSQSSQQKSSSMPTSFNESIADQMEVVEGATSQAVGKNSTGENPKIIDAPADPLPTVSVKPTPQPPVQPFKRNEVFIETQKVLGLREPTPEPEESSQELEEQADRSIDVMELDQGEAEDAGEIMEQDENESDKNSVLFETQKETESVIPIASHSSPDSGSSPKHGGLQKQMCPEVLNISEQGDNAHNTTAMAVDGEEVTSENGSNRSNNFSFNFFGNSKVGTGGDGNASGVDNFDFNFGGIGGGDDGSSNGSGGAFDFLSCGGDEEGQSSSNQNASDPFGFGASGEGSGGGDMSFNFNFDGDNDGGATGGVGGNSTSFFNF